MTETKKTYIDEGIINTPYFSTFVKAIGSKRLKAIVKDFNRSAKAFPDIEKLPLKIRELLFTGYCLGHLNAIAPSSEFFLSFYGQKAADKIVEEANKANRALQEKKTKEGMVKV